MLTAPLPDRTGCPGAAPGAEWPDDVGGEADKCDILDAVVLGRAFAGTGPGVLQICAPALP